jgi:hypothetical protein
MQPWKPVATESLAKIVGRIDRHYLVVRVREARPSQPRTCTTESGCTPTVTGFDLARMQVTGAALFKWACDDSTIPVLRLGPWPWGSDDEWPNAVAIGVPAVQEWRVEAPSREAIAAALRARVGPDAVAATVISQDGRTRFRIVYYQEGTGEDVHVIVPESTSGGGGMMHAASPFDVRC